MSRRACRGLPGPFGNCSRFAHGNLTQTEKSLLRNNEDAWRGGVERGLKEVSFDDALVPAEDIRPKILVTSTSDGNVWTFSGRPDEYS